ncbi:hypothetical protein V6X58_12940 [Pseudomonas aeruginosa]|uniref:hypothetical protein n=1 Tax=Pseudomonas TaxID=286 RepID=UPI0009A5EB1D|nr:MULTISPECIES: hypothetical protein [Pseudomonas]MBA5049055.1 hypothetical protein [Pseudomonas aeruginosa]MBI7455294.1 hypothetical protein [Pseudomonas aeruginosa]MBI7481218.1 hypothetical protein [Pseudomonas aeruginosa]MBI8458053.1 hypothetical protein [Pseudomonas aeruginosa]MBI8481227.1 hypothetical protein [Pseudomonas aeruginosa]
MNSKKCLASLIDALGGHANIRETIGQIDISGHVSSEKSDDFKQAFEDFSGKKYEDWSISIRDGEFSEISTDAVANEDVTLVIKKPVGGRIFFASLAGFSAALEDKALTLASEILVLSSFDGFKTKGFSVLPWDGEPLPGLPCLEPNSDAIDPRKGVVRDLTGNTVPADPYRWILVGHDGGGEPWNIWKTLATKNLATLLVSDVWKEDTTKVSINGARKRTFLLGEKCHDSNAYAKICQAADWILVKQDTEARHEVLVRRLSAIVRDSDTNGVPEWLTVLPESLQEALDGARLDHRAYVRSKSAETVKAMADLRKAVGEDVSRIVERIHRLSSGFVIGLAALATGLGVRLTLLTSQKNTWAVAGIIFCCVVLAITWASIILQHHVSSKSLVNELRNMKRWHKNIHIALTRSDYRELALHPVLDAIRLYKKTAKSTINGMIVSSLIFIALFVITPFFYSGKPVEATDINGDSQSSSNSDVEKSTFKVGPFQRRGMDFEVASPAEQESNPEDNKPVQDASHLDLDDEQRNSSQEVLEAEEKGPKPGELD